MLLKPLSCSRDDRAQTRDGPSLVVRLPSRCAGSVGAPVDFFACSRRYLPLSFLFLAVPDQGTHRATWRSPRNSIPVRYRATPGRCALLVRAISLLDFFQFASVNDSYRHRSGGISSRLPEFMATPKLSCLLRLFPLVRSFFQHILQLSIGRDASGGRISRVVLCA